MRNHVCYAGIYIMIFGSIIGWFVDRFIYEPLFPNPSPIIHFLLLLGPLIIGVIVIIVCRVLPEPPLYVGADGKPVQPSTN
jgi:Na+-translocating ferredoxin:NAD+ oxidoreductase RnfA subunit